VCAVSYPVTFEADYVEQRNRLTTFFRLLLMIPVAIVLYVFLIVAYVAIVIAWFAIVLTGKYPKGLYKFVADTTRFITRVTSIRRSTARRTRPTPCAWSSSSSTSTAD
jgi:hypothetical protein